jgi:nucleoside triphosphatase
MKEGGIMEIPTNRPYVVVAAILLNKEGAVFLARFPKWGNRWAIPGGKVEYGESLLNALRREVREETSINIVGADFLRMSESICDPSFANGTAHMVLIDFLVRDYTGEPILDQRELFSFQWVPLEQALSLELTPATRASIEHLLKVRNSNGK